MNAPFSSSISAADDTAALWAARLDGSELSAADRTQLDEWLAADPSHRALLSGYCQFSADLEQPLARLVETGAVSMPAFAPPPPRSRWKLFTISAFIAAAAAVMFTFWIAQPQAQFEQITTAVAQRQSITLSDGTRVELNAHTHIEVAMNPSERRVRLDVGEAFFSVEKEPSRPFIIETPAGSVRVTGTTFNVRTEAKSSLEVTVVEGSVQVRTDAAAPASPPILLSAGNQLSRTASGVSVTTLPTRTLEDALAWRQGQIVFNGVPLREALAQLSRYHNRPMTVSDSAANLLVGGRYSLDDPSGFFTALHEFLPVHVKNNADGSVQVTSREAPKP